MKKPKRPVKRPLCSRLHRRAVKKRAVKAKRDIRELPRRMKKYHLAGEETKDATTILKRPPGNIGALLRAVIGVP